jgi:hypothetical protein
LAVVAPFAAASRASTRALFSALWRNACSEESENCETTIAVEVAATTAKATPSHHLTPTKGRITPES